MKNVFLSALFFLSSVSLYADTCDSFFKRPLVFKKNPRDLILAAQLDQIQNRKNQAKSKEDLHRISNELNQMAADFIWNRQTSQLTQLVSRFIFPTRSSKEDESFFYEDIFPPVNLMEIAITTRNYDAVSLLLKLTTDYGFPEEYKPVVTAWTYELALFVRKDTYMRYLAFKIKDSQGVSYSDARIESFTHLNSNRKNAIEAVLHFKTKALVYDVLTKIWNRSYGIASMDAVFSEGHFLIQNGLGLKQVARVLSVQQTEDMFRLRTDSASFLLDLKKDQKVREIRFENNELLILIETLQVVSEARSKNKIQNKNPTPRWQEIRLQYDTSELLVRVVLSYGSQLWNRLFWTRDIVYLPEVLEVKPFSETNRLSPGMHFSR